MGLSTRLERLERRWRPRQARGPYAPEDKPPFDYDGFAAAFEELCADPRQAALEAAYGREGEHAVADE